MSYRFKLRKAIAAVDIRNAIKDGKPVHYAWKLSKVPVNTPEHIQLDYMGIDGTANFIADNNSEVTFTVNGVSHKSVFNPS